MFSKKESKQLRQQFWTSFGKSFPRKWVRYKTGIKGVALKFDFDLTKAVVALDLEGISEERHNLIWNKLLSLKRVLTEDYLPEVIYNIDYQVDTNKSISRIYVEKDGVCIHNKESWKDAMLFLQEKMDLFEAFLDQYREWLED
ncbi:MAG: DUF4268 domain-containing protein [Muriicola sp.]|nr:DUF4268 domain-containing protein [Muriicola sp.]NNK21613.1 DUF4268 domain-containing protein [Flavobacteriaceae bacterium]NNK34832.1 DUF4268 domain-containing protein [Eudoraea sp.]